MQLNQIKSTKQMLDEALFGSDLTEVSAWIVDVISKGYLDIYIKEIGRSLFDRRDVILGNPPVQQPTPTNTQTPTTIPAQFPHGTGNNKGSWQNSNAPIPHDTILAGTATSDPSVPTPTTSAKAQPFNGIPTSDEYTKYFIYRGKYYLKSAFKGKEFEMPYSVNPKYMAGVKYQVTGVGNKRLKVRLITEPKVGTRFHNCYLQGTAVFLPLSYIAHLLEQ